MRHLSNFLTEFREGFQRGAKYTCHFYLPEKLLTAILNPSLIGRIIDVVLPSIGSRIDENFSMPVVTSWLQRGLLCEATRTPNRSFSQHNQSMYGFTEHFPYHSEFLPQDCTFLMPLNKNDSPVPRVFHYWQNYIQNGLEGPDSGFDFRFPADYYATMYLVLYDQKTHPSLAYKFERVYPSNIQSANLAWADNHELLKLPVQFTYSYFTMEPYEPPPLIEIDIQLPF